MLEVRTGLDEGRKGGGWHQEAEVENAIELLPDFGNQLDLLYVPFEELLLSVEGFDDLLHQDVAKALMKLRRKHQRVH